MSRITVLPYFSAPHLTPACRLAWHFQASEFQGLSRVEGSLLLPLRMISSLAPPAVPYQLSQLYGFSFFSNLFENTFLMDFSPFSSWLLAYIPFQSLIFYWGFGMIPLNFSIWKFQNVPSDF